MMKTPELKLLQTYYSLFSTEVLGKQLILSAYREKDHTFDIVDLDSANDCLYVRVRDLISLEHGFIKWLGENNHINTELNDVDFRFCFLKGQYKSYESLLMVLSVCEKPVETLCRFLKTNK